MATTVSSVVTSMMASVMAMSAVIGECISCNTCSKDANSSYARIHYLDGAPIGIISGRAAGHSASNCDESSDSGKNFLLHTN